MVMVTKKQMRKRFLAQLILAVFILLLFQSFSLAENIIIIKSQNLPQYNMALEGFKKEMRSKGYAEGGNLKVTYSDLAGIPGNIGSFDLIYAIGTEAVKAASEKVSNKPIVFSMVLSPAKQKILKSNVSGVALDIPVKQSLETIKEIVPNAKSVGIIYDPTYSQSIATEAKAVAANYGLSIVATSVASSPDVVKAIKDMVGKIQVFWLILDPTVATKDTIPFIMNQCQQGSVAVFGFASFLVKVGAIASPVLDYEDIGRQSGAMAGDILAKGGAGELPPLAYPRNLNLAINTKTAGALGIKISSDVTKRAVETYN
ncbi:MAG: ABC transporter substrate-binding protein [bacterium]|nr:ABC transporter substrate-binding protein [bacterium]MDD5756870.1 ABC transporter substrate-binding protein [bacterium]